MKIKIDNKEFSASLIPLPDGYSIVTDRKTTKVPFNDMKSLKIQNSGEEFLITLGKEIYAVSVVAESQKSSGVIKSPLHGQIISIAVKEGKKVKKGQPLITILSMKMENTIFAEQNAVIKKVMATCGPVEKDESLLVLDYE